MVEEDMNEHQKALLVAGLEISQALGKSKATLLESLGLLESCKLLVLNQTES